MDELLQAVTSTLETLGRINSDEYVSPVEKSFLRERLQDIRMEYEQFRTSAQLCISTLRILKVNGKIRMANGHQRNVCVLSDDWMPYEEAYLLAIGALEKYTQMEPEFIPTNDDFGRIEAYYTARRQIAEILDKASKSGGSELEYLRQNFKDITTEIDAGSGVALSGFVGVKDASNVKVVAGMAGCSMSGVNESAHGKLMFFAGADGIRNASTAKTRIYEDGHLEVESGVFGGYSKVQFKRFDAPGTDFNSTTYKYTLNRNFNLIAAGPFAGYEIWLNLPSSANYIGSVVTIFDSPIRTRSSPTLILATDDPKSGIFSTLKKGILGFEPVPRIATYGGILQLIAIPASYADKCFWHVTYQYMSEFRVYEP